MALKREMAVSKYFVLFCSHKCPWSITSCNVKATYGSPADDAGYYTNQKNQGSTKVGEGRKDSNLSSEYVKTSGV